MCDGQTTKRPIAGPPSGRCLAGCGHSAVHSRKQKADPPPSQSGQNSRNGRWPLACRTALGSRLFIFRSYGDHNAGWRANTPVALGAFGGTEEGEGRRNGGMEREWLRGWYRRAEPSTSDSWSSPKLLEVHQARRASSATQRRVPMLRFMSRVATARTVRACLARRSTERRSPITAWLRSLRVDLLRSALNQSTFDSISHS